ncbi:hypothetical protein [Halalkalibacter okhensis]|uniref:hypothetical protein n=1 Tax=Halalkalibacter okhensis TaxID=333138 RepID=UPI000ACD49F3|nr:hypothetical protein [Halalkalibacter okhensis]
MASIDEVDPHSVIRKKSCFKGRKWILVPLFMQNLLKLIRQITEPESGTMLKT